MTHDGVAAMTCNLSDRVAAAIFDSDLISTRLLLAFAEFLWAVMLFWPGDTFWLPTYHLMAALAPENVWACAFGITSCLQFRIVLGSRQHTLWAHYFALWNSLLWAVVVGSMLLSVYPPPAAIAGEISLMVAAAWVWVRPMILLHYARLAHGHARQH